MVIAFEKILKKLQNYRNGCRNGVRLKFYIKLPRIFETLSVPVDPGVQQNWKREGSQCNYHSQPLLGTVETKTIF